MAYQLLQSNERSGNSSTEEYIVVLYPNTASEDSICANDLNSAHTDVGEQLLDDNTCYKYEVWISYEHPRLNDSDNLTMYNQWLNYSGPNNKENVRGCHLCVGSQNIGGRAESPNDGGAWNWSQDAILGWGSADYYKSLSVQEVFHAYINEANPTIQSMIPGNDEHDLGSVYSNNASTPMAAGYPNSQQSGTCSSSYSASTWTETLNTCERDGIKATSDAA
ncbi:hypothetical protein [Haladaptatus cibarius]|uniref:hypothetical protein n=1 Tax=Haladaptatus cibarius TaxID=453847 RepID=UPI000678A23C|nr:hypothetical protein [Haladaptatus cibarius]